MVRNQEFDVVYKNWIKWNIIIPFVSAILLIVVAFISVFALMASQINNIDFFFYEHLHYAVLLIVVMFLIFVGSLFLLYKYFRTTWVLLKYMDDLGIKPIFGKSLGLVGNFVLYCITSLFLFIIHIIYIIAIFLSVRKFNKF